MARAKARAMVRARARGRVRTRVRVRARTRATARFNFGHPLRTRDIRCHPWTTLKACCYNYTLLEQLMGSIDPLLVLLCGPKSNPHMGIFI